MGFRTAFGRSNRPADKGDGNMKDELMKNTVQRVSLKLVVHEEIEWTRKVSEPKTVYEYIRCVHPEMLESDREMMVIIGLAADNRPTASSVVSVGDWNRVLVTPAQVFKMLLLSESPRFIMAHNHPSGDLSFSPEDRTVAETMRKASAVMYIEMLDSIIVTRDSFASLVAIEVWEKDKLTKKDGLAVDGKNPTVLDTIAHAENTIIYPEKTSQSGPDIPW
jgi:DNA repair protein RadC